MSPQPGGKSRGKGGRGRPRRKPGKDFFPRERREEPGKTPTVQTNAAGQSVLYLYFEGKPLLEGQTSFGRKIGCIRCGRRRGIVRRYGLHVCRQCFREIAYEIGFRKYW